MGTYYSVSLHAAPGPWKQRIDSLLSEYNNVFSTYDPESFLSRFNAAKGPRLCLESDIWGLEDVLTVSRKVHAQTNGYFDPTVMPLVRYWGFDAARKHPGAVDSLMVDSLIGIVGFEHLSWTKSTHGGFCLEKGLPGVELDLSAIAKGYGVDVLFNHLQRWGSTNLMVEIGGEVRAVGSSARGGAWRIGIERPEAVTDLDRRVPMAVVEIDGQSMASSGNYRNFYQMEGRMVGHTIDPHSGYHRVNRLLSVSVIADNCMTADALATGWMAMGYPECIEAVGKVPDAEALFLYIGEESGIVETYATEGFKTYLSEN